MSASKLMSLNVSYELSNPSEQLRPAWIFSKATVEAYKDGRLASAGVPIAHWRGPYTTDWGVGKV